LQAKKAICARMRRFPGEEGGLQKNLRDSPGIWNRLQKISELPREDSKSSGTLERSGKTRELLQEFGADFKKQDGFPEDSADSRGIRQLALQSGRS